MSGRGYCSRFFYLLLPPFHPSSLRLGMQLLDYCVRSAIGEKRALVFITLYATCFQTLSHFSKRKLVAFRHEKAEKSRERLIFLAVSSASKRMLRIRVATRATARPACIPSSLFLFHPCSPCLEYAAVGLLRPLSEQREAHHRAPLGCICRSTVAAVADCCSARPTSGSADKLRPSHERPFCLGWVALPTAACMPNAHCMHALGHLQSWKLQHNYKAMRTSALPCSRIRARRRGMEGEKENKESMPCALDAAADTGC